MGINDEVFQSDEELRRLASQRRLLAERERPVYRRLADGRTGLTVLDVGANDGGKTADRFSSESFGKVIGLERLEPMVQKANGDYGGGRFSFYCCDVEAPSFPEQLAAIMAKNGIAAFDIIHMSFVLQHLDRPGELLRRLRPFLAPEGQLMIVEGDDDLARLEPDYEGLFQAFLDILAQDPFAGDRHFMGRAAALLEQAGYRDVRGEDIVTRLGGDELGAKRDMFQVFCSYLPEDVKLLRRREPEEERYVAWERWLDRCYGRLERAILDENAVFSTGVRVLTCKRCDI